MFRYFRVMREQEFDERVWADEKRDFVADRRDKIAAERDRVADQRDAIADARECLADEREAKLDDRQRRLDRRAASIGTSPDRIQEETNAATMQQRDARMGRHRARTEREARQAERDGAEADREEAIKRRQAGAATTGLALAFAEIAQYLYESENFEEGLTRIAETAVSAIAGCEMASITVQEGGARLRTRASTQPEAFAVDAAQYEAKEGPCVDAIEEPVVYAASFPDPRWPTLASRPTESGVEAVVSFRLRACSRADDDLLAGSLNAYAPVSNAFDDEAQEIGLILAAHASVAARVVGEREALEHLGQNLHDALSSRDVIGQAKGILMERLRITPEDAFDALRRSSQQLNVKLRQVAERLAETGAFESERRD